MLSLVKSSSWLKVVFLIVLVINASGLISQDRIYTTSRITTDPPVIDGIIDEIPMS